MYAFGIIVKVVTGKRGTRLAARLGDTSIKLSRPWDHGLSDTGNADEACKALVALAREKLCASSQAKLSYVRGSIPGGWSYVVAEWLSPGERTYPREHVTV